MCLDPSSSRSLVTAVFTKHRAGTELCGQKVWEALLSAFPLNHNRMQTVLLTRELEFSHLMAWDGHSKADVDRHFSDVSDTLEILVPRSQHRYH